MIDEQQQKWGGLAERASHRDTMRFMALNASHFIEYKTSAERLEREYQKDN